ncbi:MAG: SpoIIE family protein phosphatase [Marinilabiliaceae bacterium]|nr:SpoIIE family protein phosphatase [Marinilabiliaceae bacterium]
MNPCPDDFFLDVHCSQSHHHGEMICGDVFLSRRVREEGRTIMVLSDGMGSGVKANVLATLTASMALNFTIGRKDVRQTAEIIMKTLPVCSTRHISYSTFSIIDIDDEGQTSIVEYDNPRCLVLRGTTVFDPGWEVVELAIEGQQGGKVLHVCSFQARKDDRIFFWSDGIVQAGMGSRALPFGWGRQGAVEGVLRLVTGDPYAASARLSRKMVALATRYDGGQPKDDTSCGVIYLREPRKLLLVSGPPFDEKNDLDFALQVQQFKGKKIVAGGTTAEIIARELALRFDAGMEVTDPELPPVSVVEGIDLVTEGILTLGKALRMLESNTDSDISGNGPAHQMVKMLLESDHIHVVVGTRINMAHQDPTLPVELEMRRTLLRRMAKLLEDRYLKQVQLSFL